jgi:hypothetical protein
MNVVNFDVLPDNESSIEDEIVLTGADNEHTYTWKPNSENIQCNWLTEDITQLFQLKSSNLLF